MFLVKTGSKAISAFCVHRNIVVVGTSEGNLAAWPFSFKYGHFRGVLDPHDW